MSRAALGDVERLCDGLVEAGWLGAAILLPLVFNVYSDTRYEPEKVVVLRSVAALVVSAWIIGAVARALERRTAVGKVTAASRARRAVASVVPFAVPAAVLLLAHVSGSLVSVAPRTSWFGSYLRQQGTVTLLCYLVLFLAVATRLRRIEQWQRLAFAIQLASVPIAAHALAEQFALDPFGIGAGRARAIATLGNPIFLASYLIFPVFVSLERIFAREQSRWGRRLHGAILILQLAAVAATESRGPTAGLLVGFFFFATFGLILWKRHGAAGASPFADRWQLRSWAWLALPVAFALLVTVLFVLAIPGMPLERVREVPYLGRAAGVLDVQSSSSQVRLLIWRGIADLFERPAAWAPPTDPDPLSGLRVPLGFGPETLLLVFGRVYPPELGPRHGWHTMPDRAHNETFEILVGSGIVGLAAFLWLSVSLCRRSACWLLDVEGARARGLSVCLLTGLAAGVLGAWAFAGSARLVPIGLPLGLLGGLVAGTVREGYRSPEGRTPTPHKVLTLALFAALLAHFVDIELGIAITPTKAYFWILLGVLAAAGSGRLAHVEGQRRSGDSAGQAAISGLLCGLAVTALTFDFFAFVPGSDETVFDLLMALVAGRPAKPPGAAWLLVLCVVSAAALVSVSVQRRSTESHSWRRVWVDFALPGVAAPLVFAIVLANRLARTTRIGDASNLEPRVLYLATFFSAYHLVAMALLIATGVAVAMAHRREGHTHGSLAVAAVCVVVVIGVVGLVAAPGLDAVSADILFRQGKALAAAGRWAEATRAYDLAIERRPLADIYYFWRGTAYFEQARSTTGEAEREEGFERARRSFDRAIELNPFDPSHHANRGRLLTVWGGSVADPERRQSLWADARVSFNRALQRHPQSPELAAELARLDERR